jgi:hypothetical protein
MRSGQTESVAAVTSPAATIATLAKASLRAERNAARVRLPASRRVLEEVDAVGEQRHRPDRERDRKLRAEIGEVEDRDGGDGTAQGGVRRGGARHRGGGAPYAFTNPSTSRKRG